MGSLSLLHPLGERQTCQGREVIVQHTRGYIQAVEDSVFVDEVKQSTADICELRDRNCKNKREEKRIKRGEEYSKSKKHSIIAKRFIESCSNFQLFC